MTARSENVEAAERYLAGGDRWTEGLGKAANASSPGALRRRSGWLAWAKRYWRRGRAWLAARRPRSAKHTRLLSVAERMELGPKKALLIVSCGERRFLVASGGEAITAMLEIDPARKDLHGAQRWAQSVRRRRR